MKKTLNRIIALVAILTLVLSCSIAPAALADGTEVGTWTKSVISFETITQGKLCHAATAVLTLYEDNTFMLADIFETSYSSDNGETYNPVSDFSVIAYGTYEIVDEDEELGEIAIQFTSVTRVIRGEYDTATAGNDEDAEKLANCELVGQEAYLSSDARIEEVPSAFYFTDFGHSEAQY